MINLIKRLHRNFNKDLYIKEIIFTNNKKIKISYKRERDFKPKYLINDNHIFIHNGFRTVLTSETVAESINPLDLDSLYPVDNFKTAIESKVIKDVFSGIEKEGLDLTKLILIANLGLSLIIAYSLFTGAV